MLLFYFAFNFAVTSIIQVKWMLDHCGNLCGFWMREAGAFAISVPLAFLMQKLFRNDVKRAIFLPSVLLITVFTVKPWANFITLLSVPFVLKRRFTKIFFADLIIWSLWFYFLVHFSVTKRVFPSHYILSNVLAVAVLICVLSLLLGFPKSLGPTALLTFLISFANILKANFLDSYVKFSDLKLLPGLFNLIAQKREGFLFLIPFAIAVVALSVPFFITENYERKRSKFLAVGLVLALLTYLLFPREPKFHYFEWMNVSRYGYFGYIFLVEFALAKPPEGYSRKTMCSIAQKYITSTSKQGKNDEHPNVVVYILESVGDPSDAGLKVEPNPLENFHKLAELFPDGHAVVSIFGGMSAVTAFEILTGIPHTLDIVEFFIIKDKMPAIPRKLSEKGYFTVALHSYPKPFFNEKEALLKLGFQKVVFTELVPDIVLVRKFAKMREKIKPPYFAVLFGMETHGPWKKGPENIKFTVTDKEGKKLESKELQIYLNLTANVDKAIAELVKILETESRRTILLVVSDHLPNLEIFKNKWFVPALLWCNFECKFKDKFVLGANFLLLKVLYENGVHLDGYTKVILGISQMYDAVGKVWLKNRKKVSPSPQLERELVLISWDMLRGERYLESCALQTKMQYNLKNERD